MQGSVENISEKTGMPPGSFISVGVKESIPAKFTVYTITKQDGASKQESAVLTDELLRLSGDTVTWIDSQGLSEPGSLQLLFETLNVPPLLQEDIINTRHRPKIEAFDSHLLVVTKRIALAHRKKLHTEHVAIVLGPGYVLTFQPPVNDSFQGARERLMTLKPPYSNTGYVFYMLLDNLIDGHFAIMEQLHQRLDRLENKLLDLKEETAPLEEIGALRHDIALVRRIIIPLRKFVTDLRFKREQYFEANIDPYLTDLSDHVEQLAESCEVYHETITMLMQINSENINIRTNEIMKNLTLISTIFLPLTFITGVYGMNFEHMPELGFAWGYPLCIAFMGLIAHFLYRNFKNRKWL